MEKVGIDNVSAKIEASGLSYACGRRRRAPSSYICHLNRHYRQTSSLLRSYGGAGRPGFMPSCPRYTSWIGQRHIVTVCATCKAKYRGSPLQSSNLPPRPRRAEQDACVLYRAPQELGYCKCHLTA